MVPTSEGHLRRKLRILALLAGARRAGINPVEISQLHALAYFADALSPVWDLRVVDAQLLKQKAGPFSPALQGDVDELVGQGLVVPSGVHHEIDVDTGARLSAAYRLHWEFAERVLSQAQAFDRWKREIRFSEEVVLAFSSLDQSRLVAALAADASYGNTEVSAGRLLDIEQADGPVNLTARVALRFRRLLEDQVYLSEPELVHLYVRELDRRMANAK